MMPVERSVLSPTAVPIDDVVKVERKQAGDGVVGVAAAVRKHDARAEHIDEERGEEDGLDGHVGELERLAGDVDEVAMGEDGDVAQPP